MANKTDNISTPSVEIVKENIFVNTIQIMRIFGITRGTFDKGKKTDGFPKALYLSKRPIWKTDDIMAWAFSFNEERPLWKLIDEH